MGTLLQNISRMRVLYCAVGLAIFGLCQAQHANPDDLDPLDDIDEKEFEEYFDLDPVKDPKELKRRNEALKANEAAIYRQTKILKLVKKHGLIVSTSLLTFQKMSLLRRKLGPMILLKEEVCCRLQKRRDLIKSLRTTFTLSATTGHLYQHPTAQ